jgi:hypothetical protein
MASAVDAMNDTVVTQVKNLTNAVLKIIKYVETDKSSVKKEIRKTIWNEKVNLEDFTTKLSYQGLSAMFTQNPLYKDSPDSNGGGVGDRHTKRRKSKKAKRTRRKF